MWKSNVTNIFHIPCWPAGVSTGQNTKLHRKVNTPGVCQNTWYAGSWLTAHASTQPAVGTAKHHNQNAYLTAMFGQYIGGYFNNYIRLQSQTEFTATHRKQHGILWLDTSVCRACANRSTEVGTLLKRHTLVPSPTIPLHSVAWLEKGRGNSLKCNRDNFSARRSGGITGTWLLR